MHLLCFVQDTLDVVLVLQIGFQDGRWVGSRIALADDKAPRVLESVEYLPAEQAGSTSNKNNA